MSAIQKAVKCLGSQDKLADAIGVSQGRVSQWANGELIPTKYFPLIHRATDGKVTPEELLAEQLERIEPSHGHGLN
jgi:DNA-binding transcriptional regulator YdaS (Cro superfamily)